MTGSLNRRNLFRAGAAAAVGATATGCGGFWTLGPQGSKDNGAAGPDYTGKEAPMLAARVKRGELPPLEQRLPSRPAVVTPIDAPGVYGGEIREGTTAPGDGYQLNDIARAGLVEWDLDAKEPIAGLAESWRITEGGKVFTFALRQGLRWSDGQPFTADDIVFTNDKINSNTTLNPAYPNWLVRGGKPPDITKVDDHTVRFRFAAPHGLFLRNLCFQAEGGQSGGQAQIASPAHYLKNFHPDYRPVKELDAQAKKKSFSGWNDYFVNRNDPWQNPDRPVLGAWKIVHPAGSSGTYAAAERNPYFWKTDDKGRQLPYVDRLSWTILTTESLALRAAGGELDLGGTAGLGFQEVPLLVKSQQRGRYTLAKWTPDGQFAAVYLNMSHKDPVLRGLFQNLDFRAGLSHAINRNEINDSILAGQGTLQHPCAQPGDDYYVEGMGYRFTKYDLAEANRRLDRAGIAKRGGDGFRLRPDGKRLILTLISFPLGLGVAASDVYEYVQRYWARVGVRLQLKTISVDLWYQRTPQGDYDVAGYPPAGYKWDIDPLWYVPVDPLSYFAPLYGVHYVNAGKKGLKPTPPFAKLQAIYDQLRGEIDPAKQKALGRRILRAHDRNVWIIGTVRPPFTPMIVSNDLLNVRRDAVASFRTGYDEATAMEQVSFKDPRVH